MVTEGTAWDQASAAAETRWGHSRWGAVLARTLDFIPCKIGSPWGCGLREKATRSDVIDPTGKKTVLLHSFPTSGANALLCYLRPQHRSGVSRPRCISVAPAPLLLAPRHPCPTQRSERGRLVAGTFLLSSLHSLPCSSFNVCLPLLAPVLGNTEPSVNKGQRVPSLSAYTEREAGSKGRGEATAHVTGATPRGSSNNPAFKQSWS